jgi:hypothetical protein
MGFDRLAGIHKLGHNFYVGETLEHLEIDLYGQTSEVAHSTGGHWGLPQ